jgi:hypothetical protein
MREYLNGEIERMFFDLDFDHYLIQNYPKMERENRPLAECFYYYVSEEGIDRCTDDMTDDAHRDFMCEQFEEFEKARKDGMY